MCKSTLQLLTRVRVVQHVVQHGALRPLNFYTILRLSRKLCVRVITPIDQTSSAQQTKFNNTVLSKEQTDGLNRSVLLSQLYCIGLTEEEYWREVEDSGLATLHLELTAHTKKFYLTLIQFTEVDDYKIM